MSCWRLPYHQFVGAISHRCDMHELMAQKHMYTAWILDSLGGGQLVIGESESPPGDKSCI
jgi:hypothetical protein